MLSADFVSLSQVLMKWKCGIMLSETEKKKLAQNVISSLQEFRLAAATCKNAKVVKYSMIVLVECKFS
jgi:hypothetical protein